MRGIVGIVFFVLAGCSTEVEHLRYDDRGISPQFGVRLLRDPPKSGEYQSLGEKSYSFYRPGWREPTIGDVWDDLSQRVQAAGGDACLVKYQYVSTWTARSIDVTCEIFKRTNAGGTGATSPSAARPALATPEAVGKFQFNVDRMLGDGECRPFAPATLMTSGAGVETYSGKCSNGDVAIVRCEFGQCRLMR